jgi:hypothetical protein
VDRGDAGGIEHARRVRSDELAVVGDGERTDPGVEQLDRVSACSGLRGDVAGELLGQPLHQRVPGRRLPVHEGLRKDEVTARPALDEVARDGERAATEANQRPLGLEVAPHAPHGLEDRRRPCLWRSHPEPLDGSSRVDPLLHHRPDTLDELHLDPHSEDGRHDVREEDRGVDAVPAHRLQRHLGAKLGRPRDLEEAVPLSQRPVLG